MHSSLFYNNYVPAVCEYISAQPGNDLREVSPGHRLLPHAPLGLHKVEERATGEVLQNVAVETASSCQEALRAVARIHYHRKHQRYSTNMKKNSTLFMFKQLRSYCLYLALFKKKVEQFL